jgi:hypothetical protein
MPTVGRRRSELAIRVLSCVVRRRYLRTASEQKENFMCAVVVLNQSV